MYRENFFFSKCENIILAMLCSAGNPTGKLFRLLLIIFLINMWPLISYAEDGNPQKTDLVLGVRTDASPFSSCPENKEGKREAGKHCEGYTFTLCQRIAERAVKEEGLYCDIEYKEVDSSNRFKLLEEKEIDMLCGASTVTLERMRIADFTLFTFLSGASVMYRPPQKDQEHVFKIGVLQATTSEEQINRIINIFMKKQDHYLPKLLSNHEIVTVEDHYTGLKKIIDNDIQAYLADREILLSLRKKGREMDKEVNLIVLEDYFTTEQYAIGLRRDAADLRFVANSVLSEMFDWENYDGSNGHIYNVLRQSFPGKRFSKSLENMYRLQRLNVGERLTGFLQRANCGKKPKE